MNYTTGETGKGQGFPRSLVAVRGGGGGAVGVRGPMYLGQSIMNTEPISLTLCLILPYNQDKRKGNHPLLG